MIDSKINDLIADLRPVRPRRIGLEAGLLGALGAIELALYIALGQMRPDFAAAMHDPTLWWKFASLGAITGIGIATALRSLDPSRHARPGLRVLLGIVVAVLAVGWMLDAADPTGGSIGDRLDWHDGIQCVVAMVVLSLPPLVAFGVLMRRGAAVDPARTALAAGLAGAAWGALIFAVHCPSDDPLYISVWYVVSCGLSAGLGRLLLSRIGRW